MIPVFGPLRRPVHGSRFHSRLTVPVLRLFAPSVLTLLPSPEVPADPTVHRIGFFPRFQYRTGRAPENQA